MKSQMVGWFEIPVTDMERAIKFYSKVFKVEIKLQQFGPTAMGWFPFADDANAKGASGTLIHNPEHYQPSSQGALIYFTSRAGDIKDELTRVEKAGGKVLKEKTQISEDHGYMALILDTEGNRIALHSMK